jgi:hypothetical protein
MGLKKATVKLGADISQFQSKMKKASRSFKRMGHSMKRLGKSMSMSLTLPLVAFAAASVKAFDVQAKAEAKLLTALKGNEAAFKSLKKQAQELQKITLFGDEQTMAAQSMLASMGLEEEAIKRLTPLIQDMATAKGMDLKAAADLVAKSVGSSTNALSRYGITIEGAVGSTDRLDSAVEALSGQFLGQSEAAAKAGAGGLTQLKNDFGDLMETIGEMLMPVLNKLIEKVKEGIGFIKGLSKAQVKNTMKWLALAAAIGPVLIIIGQLSIAIGVLTANPIILILAGITALALKLRKDFTPAVNAAFIAENRLYKLRKKYGDDLDSGKRTATGQLDVAFMVGSGKENVEAEIKKTASAIDILTKALGKYVDMPIAEVPMGGMGDAGPLPNFKDLRKQLFNAKEDLINLNFALIDVNKEEAKTAAGLAKTSKALKTQEENATALAIAEEQLAIQLAALRAEHAALTAQMAEEARITELWDNSWKSLGQTMLVDVAGAFATAVTAGGNMLTNLGNMFKSLLKQLAAMVIKAAVFAAIMTAISGGAAAGGASFGQLFQSTLTGAAIPGMASGGPVAGNSPYIVGEVGPELFVPNSSGTIIPNGQLGGAQTIIPDVRISGEDLIIVFDRANRHRKSLG